MASDNALVDEVKEATKKDTRKVDLCRRSSKSPRTLRRNNESNRPLVGFHCRRLRCHVNRWWRATTPYQRGHESFLFRIIAISRQINKWNVVLTVEDTLCIRFAC